MAVAIVLSVSGGVTFNLISSTNPSTIAANIALQFPESSGLGGEHADRLRPGAVRHHPAGQRRSPATSSTAAASSREPTDEYRDRARDATQQTAHGRALAASLPSVATPVRELPSWAPWAILGGAAVVVGGGLLAGRPRRRPGGRRHGRRVRPGRVPDLAGGRGPAQGDGPAGDRAWSPPRSSSRWCPLVSRGRRRCWPTASPGSTSSSSPTRCAAWSARAAAATTPSSAR